MQLCIRQDIHFNSDAWLICFVLGFIVSAEAESSRLRPCTVKVVVMMNAIPVLGLQTLETD